MQASGSSEAYCLFRRSVSAPPSYLLPISEEYVPEHLSAWTFGNVTRVTHGKGAMATVKNAKREVAHWYPSLLYTASTRQCNATRTWCAYQDLLWTPKRGNAAAKLLLAKLFAARALAAYKGYASTRKVNTPEKTNSVLLPLISEVRLKVEASTTYPMPKMALPMIGTIQWTEEYLVRVNLYSHPTFRPMSDSRRPAKPEEPYGH